MTNNRSIRELIFKELLLLLGSHNKDVLLALRLLCEQFVVEPLEVEDELWGYNQNRSTVTFLIEGVVAEYIRDGRKSNLLKIHKNRSFAFSEDVVLYKTPSKTLAKCIVPGKIAHISYHAMQDVFDRFNLTEVFISQLVEISMTQYRQSTYELLQSNGIRRILAVIEEQPDVLELVPRSELADYLGISRASLFRYLKQLNLYDANSES